MPPGMIRYRLTRRDLFLARVWTLFRNRGIILFYSGLGFFFWWSFSGENELAKLPFLAKAIAAGVMMVMFVALGLTATMILLFIGTFKRNTGVLGEHEIELKDEGLLERTAANETLNRWGAFHKVYGTRGALYIYVTDTQVHIIPRRFFSSTEHLREFQSEIERRVAAAKSA
jgi:hypothetical protein